MGERAGLGSRRAAREGNSQTEWGIADMAVMAGASLDYMLDALATVDDSKAPKRTAAGHDRSKASHSQQWGKWASAARSEMSRRWVTP